MGSRPLVCLILSTAVLGFRDARASDGEIDRHPWAQATPIKGRRYVVKTNTWPEVGRSLSSRLERSFSLYEARFGPLARNRSGLMRVALFRTGADYYAQGGGVRGALGHFDAALDRCALVWDGSPTGDGWPIAVHEACHHYLWRRHPHVALPAWYSEGIACYFEGLLDEQAPAALARLRLRAARAALQSGEAQLELLLRARVSIEDGRLRVSNFPTTRFYGLSWSLVHFLARDPAYRERFRRFEARLFAARTPASKLELEMRRVLLEECGPAAELERGWRKYIAALPDLEPRPRGRIGSLLKLHSGTPYECYTILRRIGGGGLSPDLRAHVAATLCRTDLVVRREAARVLAASPGPGGEEEILAALDGSTPKLRPLLLRALAHPGAGMAVERLLAEQGHREAALRALVAIGDARAREAFRAALGDPELSALTRRLCAQALRADPGAREALTAAAQDKAEIVRTAARTSLTALDTLIERPMALDRYPAPKPLILRTLPQEEQIGPPPPESAPAGMPALMRRASDLGAPPEERVLACRELAELEERDALPLLRRLCGPRVPERVRLEALRALVRITGETRGFRAGQPAREREAVFRAWQSQ